MDGSTGPPRVVLVTDEPGAAPRADRSGGAAASDKLILKARRMDPERIAPEAAPPQPERGAGLRFPSEEESARSVAPEGGVDAVEAEGRKQQSAVRLPETLTHWQARVEACQCRP